MLKHRLLMSALLIPTTIGLFAWDHRLGGAAPILFVLVLTLSVRCVWEFVTLARTVGFQPNLWLCAACVAALLTATWWPHWPIEFYFHETLLTIVVEPGHRTVFQVIGLASVLLLMNAVFRYPLVLTRQAPGGEVATLGVEFLIVSYVGLFLAITSELRWLGKSTMGYFALGALVVAAKMGDVGAYTFGRLIGGPKLTPKLSPGKTWSGGFGHLLTAGICSVIWLCWLGPLISDSWPVWNPAAAATFGVVVGAAGLIGDLAESLIKRDIGVKDAPTLLPGFGGLLDLMDSILLAGPVAYAMWQLLGS